MSTTLVTKLRQMVAASDSEYTIGTTTFWTDDQLEALIDARVCARLIQTQIDLIPSTSPSGHIEFLNGRVLFPGTLDTDTATVVAYTGGEIAGDVTIFDDGRLDFTADQMTANPMLSGLAYDLYGAAADLLTSWSAAIKSGVDIAEDGQSFKRSQGHDQMLKQIDLFRARSVAGTVQLGRSDRHGRRGRRSDAVLASWRRWGNPQR